MHNGQTRSMIKSVVHSTPGKMIMSRSMTYWLWEFLSVEQLDKVQIATEQRAPITISAS